MMLLTHLPILPIVIPLVVGSVLILLPEHRRWLRMMVGMCAIIAQLVVALIMVYATQHDWTNGVVAYLPGDWPAPFGIVLVVDRLSAAMLVLSSLLMLCAYFYSLLSWERAGRHFYSLVQFLLLGVNGAFLTGDLFNLFVFFEVFLASSYGLLLHGSGRDRVASGLHYIAINLFGSFLLLIGISLIYGVSGTLNMADLALKAGQLSGTNRTIFESAAAILGIAFLIKAGAWPLNFWLVKTYSASCAPVAAMFSILTKVGIYALLRIGSLLIPSNAPAAFHTDWMFVVGLVTLSFGGLGLLSARQLNRSVGYCIIMSAGTLLAALGMPGVTLTGPALFYLVNSVFATSAFFLIAEMISRLSTDHTDLQAAHQDWYEAQDKLPPDHVDEVGFAIPASMAFLGLGFIACVLLVTGMPPLAGFIAKFSLLSAAIEAGSYTASPINAWILVGALLLSGLAGMISFTRIGLRIFWVNPTRDIQLSVFEVLPVVMLIGLTIVLMFWAGPISNYLAIAAQSLDRPNEYIDAVLSTPAHRYLGAGL